MPKRTHIINRFEGGINEESNSRDLEANEVVSAKNVAVDHIGKVKTTPYSRSVETTYTDSDQVSGDGIFLFSTDYLRGESGTSSGSEADTGDDYIAIADSASGGGVRIRSRINGQDSGGAIPIKFATLSSDNRPVYYVADGGLRICDSNFGDTNNLSRWYGYVKRTLFSNIPAHKYAIAGWKHEKTDIDIPAVASSLVSGTTLSTSSVSSNKTADVSIDGTNNDTGYTSNTNAVHANDTDSTFSKANLGFTGSQDYVKTVRVRVKVDGYSTTASWMIEGVIRVGIQNSTSFASTGYQYATADLSQEVDPQDNFPNFTETEYEYTFSFPDSGVDISSDNLRVSLRQLSNDSSGTYKIDNIFIEGGNGIGDTAYNSSPNAVNVVMGDSATTSDDWSDDWNVGVSFVYDGNQESLVRPLTISGGKEYITLTKSPYTNVGFNFTSSWNQRITGVNVYVKKTSETDWRLHAILDMVGGTIQRYGDPQKFECSYSTANTGYLFNLKGEVSKDIPYITYEAYAGYGQDLNTLTARYKTAVVANRRAYVANVMVEDENGNMKKYADRIIKSPPNKFDVLPLENSLEVTVNDGESITALVEYGDRLLQFKERTLYIINISGQVEFNEGVYHYRGVKTKAQVCKTDVGVAWINENGCFFFDGRQVRDLMEKRGKRAIKKSTWTSFISDKSMIVYQPDIQQLAVVKSYDNTANSGDAYIYDMVTGSWVYQADFVDSDKKKTNLINDWNGKITYCIQDGNNTVMKQVVQSETSQTGFELITPDIDFGNPASSKNIYNIQVTYTGGTGQDARLYYRVDSGSWVSEFGDELITNGTFDTDKTGWSENNRVDATINNQRLRVASNAQTGGTAGNAIVYQSFTTVVGETYRVTGNFYAGTDSGAKISVGKTDALSTGVYQGGTSTMTTNTSVDFTFIAVDTTQVVFLYQVAIDDDEGDYHEWDNISINLVAQLNSTSASQTITEFSPQNFVENAKSFQLKFSGTIASGFEINDVAIEYREKRAI